MLNVLGALIGLLIVFAGIPWLLLLIDRSSEEWMEWGPIKLYFRYVDWVVNRKERIQ